MSKKAPNFKRQALIAERLRFETLRKKRGDQKGNLPLFAAGVAHEFNNILGAADGHAEWGLDSGKPEDMRRALETVRLACRRSSQITRALQSLFQPFEEKVRIFSLKRIASDLEKLFNAELHKENVGLEIQVGDEKIYGDSGRIFEIFVNLMRNSLSALGPFKMSEKKQIKIQTQVSGKKLKIFFSDNGPGIPENYLDEIFEPFFTTKGAMAHVSSQAVGGSPASTSEGSGLGLFLCRQIAGEHGGSLRALPVAKGARFELLLPLQA